MGTVTEFYREYEKNNLSQVSLPSAITEAYEIKACLKMSQEKQIYLAVSKANWRKYIIKAVHIGSPEKPEDEYRLHQDLKHRGIVPVSELISEGEYRYLVREYAEGNTITELVEMSRDGYLPQEEIIRIVLMLCDILEYLHSRKPPVIHRDIKPDNIIIDGQGECKLIDFGISRQFHEETETDTVAMGSRFSAPPEQYGFAQTDARSDIYAIGVLIFYMASGSLDIKEIEEYTITKGLLGIIRKCTRFSPSERYETVKQLKESLMRHSLPVGKKRICIAAIGAGIFLLLGMVLSLDRWREIHKSSASGLAEGEDTILAGMAEDVPQISLAGERMGDAREPVSEPTLSPEQAEPEQVTSAQGISSISQSAPRAEEATPGSAVIQDTAYEFKSPQIEQAVREILGKSEKEEITLKDLSEITSLYLCGRQTYHNWTDHFVYGKSQYMRVAEYNESGKHLENGGITELEDVSQMINLESLALYNQNISDLTPLGKLRKLKQLGLGANNITVLEPLLSVQSLEFLDISANPVDNADIKSLTGLPALKGLDLGGTDISSIYEIKDIPLTYLSIYDCKTGACEGLDQITTLDTFITTGVGNTITEAAIERIAKLPALRYLHIMGSGDFDLSKLSSLDTLYSMDLCGSLIKDLKPLKTLNIEQLWLDVMPSFELAGIEKLEKLVFVSLGGTNCADYTPLLKLKNLKAVNCNEEQQKIMREQMGEIPFRFGYY